MPDRPRTIYWDSCIFLLYIEGTPEWMPVLDSLLDRASKTGDIVIVTSTLSIVEVAFSTAERADGLMNDATVAAIDALWSDRSAVQLVEFDQVIARDARRLLRQSIDIDRRLKPMDAIHLATAAITQVDDCHTTDDRLQRWNDLGFPVRDPWTETPQLGIQRALIAISL
jgi:predicted nucleic acid-binding protein